MRQYSGLLQVNLTAIRKNWQLLRAHYSGSDCGAVVKTNAYGLGVAPVSKSLFDEGCRTFFVANFDEGLELRQLLPKAACIYVLQGCVSGMEVQFIEHDLIPVLISLPMYRRWFAAVGRFAEEQQIAKIPRCAIKVNTGMNRLGMMLDEFEQICSEGSDFRKSGLVLIVSHLACADEPEHPLNVLQLQAFESVVENARRQLPGVKASLVNSAGVFLPSAWQFDVARPGIGLFGGAMTIDGVPVFNPVVSLHLPILQVRDLAAGESVGYGATFQAKRNMRIAIVAGGYGDGVLRSLSGLTSGWLHKKIPLLGRVSMDSCVFDVTELSGSELAEEGDLIEVIGEHCLLDDIAEHARTIAYELLTRLGDRLEKKYCE